MRGVGSAQVRCSARRPPGPKFTLPQDPFHCRFFADDVPQDWWEEAGRNPQTSINPWHDIYPPSFHTYTHNRLIRFDDNRTSMDATRNLFFPGQQKSTKIYNSAQGKEQIPRCRTSCQIRRENNFNHINKRRRRDFSIPLQSFSLPRTKRPLVSHNFTHSGKHFLRRCRFHDK